jgi:bifunctional non-homologous end joining protein LigD
MPGQNRSERERRDAITVAGVRITHPDKLWWPDERITKLDVVRYYDGIAGRILPWLDRRPLTAERCPDGMKGECFFQKDFSDGLPPGVPTRAIAAESAKKTVHYVIGGAKETLLALVNLGCIAIHVMNCRTDSLEQPDWLAFDLDPSTGKFSDAARAGLALHAVLEELGVRSYPKTSGGRGLHVFAPLRRGASQESVRAFAQSVGAELARRQPRLVTIEMSKSRRGKRVFADPLRNAFGQTIVPPYSVRRRRRAPVSTPLDWSEVDPKLDPAAFNMGSAERRFAGKDPWTGFWKHRQTLPKPGEEQ